MLVNYAIAIRPHYLNGTHNPLHYLKHPVQPLQLVHTDLWGPSLTMSTHGYTYHMHFMDDYSKFTWIYPLKLKSEAFGVLKNLKRYVEKSFNTKICAIESD